MNYLNLNISTLRAPEFLGSDPVARATWLCVVGYCIDQENNGRIAACKVWRDRQWQQTCGVTLEEVNASAPLLEWDGDDLTVWRYPLAHQAKCETNRANGKAGGLSKSQAKSEAARINGAKHKPSEDPSEDPSETEASTQHKIKKGKDKDKDKVMESTAPGEPVAKERPRDLIFEALCEATGVEAKSLTKPGRGALNAALRDIRAASPDVTPQEVKQRAERYQRKFSGAALTAPALAKHWASLGKAPLDDWTKQALANHARAEPAPEPQFDNSFAESLLADIPEVKAQFGIR